MPTKAETRRAYEARVAEHPRVKALPPRRAPGPVKQGVPKLIAQAMNDPDMAKAVTALRRMQRYESRVDDLARRRQRGEKISLNEQTAIIRQGANVENDLRDAVRLASGGLQRDPALEACATAIASRPQDTEVIDNIPAYLNRDEKAALRYIGVDLDELGNAWNRELKAARQEIMRSRPGELNRKLQSIEESANRFKYPRAPRHLVEQGVLTLGGDATITIPLWLFWLLVAGWIIVAIIAIIVVFGLIKITIIAITS